MANRLTRGKLLRRTAAGVAGGTLLVEAEAAPAAALDGKSVLTGRVDRVEGPDRLHVLTSQGSILVTLVAGATVFDDEGPAALSSFVAGDEVGVEGSWSAGAFRGSSLQPLYRPVQGLVVEVRDGRLHTTGGTVSLVSHTRRHTDHGLVPLASGDLRPGARVNVLARMDPKSRTLVAVVVY